MQGWKLIRRYPGLQLLDRIFTKNIASIQNFNDIIDILLKYTVHFVTGYGTTGLIIYLFTSDDIISQF